MKRMPFVKRVPASVEAVDNLLLTDRQTLPPLLEIGTPAFSADR